MRTLLLLTVVIAAPTLAADAALGESLFRERCASCHTASPTATDATEKKSGRKSVDLALRMKQRTGEQLKSWVLEPGKRKVETACNTLALAREPELAPDLWAFLQGQLEAPPLPQQERRKEALRKNQWRSPQQATDTMKKGGK